MLGRFFPDFSSYGRRAFGSLSGEAFFFSNSGELCSMISTYSANLSLISPLVLIFSVEGMSFRAPLVPFALQALRFL